MASFKKRFKKIVRTIHKYEGRVLKVAAPVVGAVFGGVVGAAAGTALGTAASYYGEKQGALAKGRKGKAVKKAGKRGLKSGLIIGGIVTGGTAVAALAGAGGLATGVATQAISAAAQAKKASAPRSFIDPASADPALEGQLPGTFGPPPGNPVLPNDISGGELSRTVLPGSSSSSGAGVSGILGSLLGVGNKVYEKIADRKSPLADIAAGGQPSQSGLLGGLGDMLDPTNPDGSTDWTKIALIGGGVFLLVAMSKKAA